MKAVRARLVRTERVDEEMNVLSSIIGNGLCCCLFVVSLMPSLAIGQKAIPIRTADRIIQVPLQIQGNDHFFLLSLSQSVHVVDISLRPFLGEPIRTGIVYDDAGNERKAKEFRVPRMLIDGRAIGRDASLVCLRLEAYNRQHGTHVSGILGAPFLQGHTVEFDFDNDFVRFWKKKERLALKNRATAKRLVFSWNVVGSPTIPQIDVGPLRLRSVKIDTISNCGMILPSTSFDRLVKTGNIRRVHEKGSTTAFGTRSTKSGILHGVQFAGWKLPPIDVRQGGDHCQIGFPVVEKFWWLFDVDNGTIYVDKGKKFSNPLLPSNEIHVKRDKNKWRVLSVDADGWAAKARIEEGAVIRAIGNKKCDSMTLAGVVHALRTLRATGGRLTLGKNGKEYWVTVSAARTEQENEE